MADRVNEENNDRDRKEEKAGEGDAEQTCSRPRQWIYERAKPIDKEGGGTVPIVDLLQHHRANEAKERAHPCSKRDSRASESLRAVDGSLWRQRHQDILR